MKDATEPVPLTRHTYCKLFCLKMALLAAQTPPLIKDRGKLVLYSGPAPKDGKTRRVVLE